MAQPFNANILREEGKAELTELLESLRGKKCLVLDVQLGDLLNQVLIEGSKLLKETGVSQMKELKGDLDFGSESSRDVPDNIIYFVRPNLAMMKVIARQVRSCVAAGFRSQYHIFFVPHRTVACEQVLEDEGVLDHIEISEFNLGFVPFDNDLISLEMDSVFKQCYVDLDTSSLNAAARALSKFQSIYGVIPNIKAKGLTARKVVQKLLHLRREEENAQSHIQSDRQALAGQKQVEVLVVLDREVDLVSPLISPLTYEGLIDELIGIENGRVKLEPSVLGDDKDIPAALQAGGRGAPSETASASGSSAAAPVGKVSVVLNNADPVFSEIRDLSIERLGSYLQEKAIHVRESYSSFRGNKDASLVELHDFVKKIPQLTKEYKSLNMHINVAEIIKKSTDSRAFRELWQSERAMMEGENYLEQIEDMICEDATRKDLYKVLRLLCIQSLTSGGVRTNKLDVIRRLIAQTYGYEHLFTLANLERSGLIKRKDMMLVETTSVWQNLRRSLRLIDDRINMAKPDDFSYVSAGYAPMSVRLVQALGGVSCNWNGISDAMRLIPGPMVEFTQSESVAEELNEAITRSNAETLQSSMMTSVVSAAAAAAAAMVSGASAMSSPGLFNPDAAAFRDRSENKPIMLVFLLGGLSFLEVAAFRFLSKDPTFPYTIVMATTKLINGNKLLHSLEHEVKARSWKYPSNYPVREYQVQICKECLFSNTLVALPTGLGKTLIAAVVMYNFYEWFPFGLVIFMAPTRPLVTQQISACHSAVGIPEIDCAHIEGSVSIKRREELWSQKRVVFCTPQTLDNDIDAGRIDVNRIVCIIVDEAHRATGNYAYTTAVQSIHRIQRESNSGSQCRVVALSATPGTDKKKIEQVIRNLFISHIEVRAEDDPDVAPYTNDKQVQIVRCPKLASNEVSVHEVRKMLAGMMKGAVMSLNRANLMNCSNPANLNSMVVDESRIQLQRLEAEGACFGEEAKHQSDAIIELMELLKCKRAFGDGDPVALRNCLTSLQENMQRTLKSPTSKQLMELLRRQCTNMQTFQKQFPKLEKLRQILTEHFSKEQSTRAIVFTHLRTSVYNIVSDLSSCIGVRPKEFVGQSSKGSSDGDGDAVRGMNQKEQAQILVAFNKGEYNVLVATSIAEEGLDIAEVDLIVLFDAVASPTRIVQRMGRTGRKRAGNVVMLVVDGTESDKVSSGHSSAASLCNMLRNAASTLRLCASSPRMIPPDLPLPVMRTEDFEISDFHLSQVGGNISKTKDLAGSKSKKADHGQKTMQAFMKMASPSRDVVSETESLWGSFAIPESPLQPIQKLRHARPSEAAGSAIGFENRQFSERPKADTLLTGQPSGERLDVIMSESAVTASTISAPRVWTSPRSHSQTLSPAGPAYSDRDIDIIGSIDRERIRHRYFNPLYSEMVAEWTENKARLIARGDNLPQPNRNMQWLHFQQQLKTGMGIFRPHSCSSTSRVLGTVRRRFGVHERQQDSESSRPAQLYPEVSPPRFSIEGVFDESDEDEDEAKREAKDEAEDEGIHTDVHEDVDEDEKHISAGLNNQFEVQKTIEDANSPRFSHLLSNSSSKYDEPHAVIGTGGNNFVVALMDEDDDSNQTAVVEDFGIHDQCSVTEVTSFSPSPVAKGTTLSSDYSPFPRSQANHVLNCSMSSDDSPPVQVIPGLKSSKLISTRRTALLTEKSPPRLQSSSHMSSSNAEVDEICSVCLRADWEPGDEIVFCDGTCGGCVHLRCYGLTEVPVEDFYCDRCAGIALYSESEPCCWLCGASSGMMRKSTCGKLVHYTCVLFCPELTMNSRMRANNLAAVKAERNCLRCIFCNKTIRGCLQCAFPGCLISFHAHCARSAGRLLLIRNVSDVKSGDRSEEFVYEIYCSNHQAVARTTGIVSSSLATDCSQQSRSDSDDSSRGTPSCAGNTVDQSQSPDGNALQNTPLTAGRPKLNRKRLLAPNRKVVKKLRHREEVASRPVQRDRLFERPPRPKPKSKSFAGLKFFDEEAILSGSDSGDEPENEFDSEGEEGLQDSFINDSDYSQDETMGASTQAALYFKVNNQLSEFSPSDGRFGFRGAEKGLPLIAKILKRSEMRVCDLNDSLANSVDLSGEYCESSCYLSDDALSDQSNDSREVGGEAYGTGVKEQDYSREHYSRKNGSKLLAKSGERPFSSHFEVLLDDDED